MPVNPLCGRVEPGRRCRNKGRPPFAKAYDSPVCLLHIQAHADLQDRQSLAQSIQRTVNRVGSEMGNLSTMDVRVRILDGELSERVCETALDEHADLLILGRGRTREGFAQVWSHLYAIIRESPCPVLSGPSSHPPKRRFAKLQSAQPAVANHICHMNRYE